MDVGDQISDFELPDETGAPSETRFDRHADEALAALHEHRAASGGPGRAA